MTVANAKKVPIVILLMDTNNFDAFQIFIKLDYAYHFKKVNAKNQLISVNMHMDRNN
jgi:hypothetical protein